MIIEALLINKNSCTHQAQIKLKDKNLNNQQIVSVSYSLIAEFNLGTELLLKIENNLIISVKQKPTSIEDQLNAAYNEVLSIIKDIRYQRD